MTTSARFSADVIGSDLCRWRADMMPALHNYVTVDSDAFLSDVQRMEMLFDMCKTVSVWRHKCVGLAGGQTPARPCGRFSVVCLLAFFRRCPDAVQAVLISDVAGGFLCVCAVFFARGLSRRPCCLR